MWHASMKSLVTKSASWRSVLTCKCWGSRFVITVDEPTVLCLGFFTRSWNFFWSETGHHARYARLFTSAILCTQSFWYLTVRDPCPELPQFLYRIVSRRSGMGFPLWRIEIVIVNFMPSSVNLNDRCFSVVLVKLFVFVRGFRSMIIY
jgi:hypothetical protein